MEQITSADQLRDLAQKYSKDFKSSWIELGGVLYSIYKEKNYKYWGYSTFETYTVKELGIQNKTASKLLRSYFFLESKEPQYLEKEYYQEAEATQVPTYDAVNTLRLASNNKNLEPRDYNNIKQKVFERGRDQTEVAKELTALVKERKQVDGEEERERARLSVIKRFISTIKSCRQEMATLKLVPKKVLAEADHLIKEMESYL